MRYTLREMSTFIGLSSTFLQMIAVLPVLAQSTAEQQICRQNGQYAVIAMRPLRGGEEGWEPPPTGSTRDLLNLQSGHEHIFFCEDGRVVDNVGFGPVTQGDLSGRGTILRNEVPTNYVIREDERYDAAIMRQVISSYQCSLAYNILSRNCQDYVESIRQSYWRNMFIGTWEGYFPCGSDRYVLQYAINGNNLIQTVISHGGSNCLPNGHTSVVAQIPDLVSKGSVFTSIIHLGTGNQTRSARIRVIDANTFEYEGTVLRRVAQ